MKKEAIKIDKKMLDKLRELKRLDGRLLVWHIERAVFNYLKSKKMV